ncbi:MAG: ABC transporter permease [Alphaproteobacteria bacterium]|nr:ABC transporter permease [Alphaproteobacteria bacterium]
MSGWALRLFWVFAKEARDHARDRRSLMLALIYPLLGPLLVAGGLALAGKTLSADWRARAVEVPAVGLEHAPALAAHLAQHNIRATPAPPDPREAVRAGRAPVVLVIPQSAQGRERFEADVITNLGRVDNLRATARLTEVVRLYNEDRAAARARAAGLPDDYARTVTLNNVNVAQDANIAVFFYNMVPPLVIFMIFLGGVHLAVDTTVGERERGSLEPLLLAPVERGVLLAGKALATLAFTAVTTAVNLFAFKGFMELAAAGSARLVEPPDWTVFAWIFVLSIPLMAIAVALQMSIAVVTRSMKEAQIYLGLLPLAPALPGMVMIFSPLTLTTANAAVPVLGQLLMITKLVAGQGVDLVPALGASVTTLAAAAGIFALAARGFTREKMFVLG